MSTGSLEHVIERFEDGGVRAHADEAGAVAFA